MVGEIRGVGFQRRLAGVRVVVLVGIDRKTLLCHIRVRILDTPVLDTHMVFPFASAGRDHAIRVA